LLKKSIALSFVILHVFSGYLAAESLTWSDCVKEARKANPDILSAAESVKQGESAVVSARSSLLPSVDSNLSGGRSGGDESGTGDSFSVGVSARQLVFDGGKASVNTKKSKEQVLALKYKYDITSANTRLKLRLAFVDLLKAQRQVTINEDILKRRKQNTKLIQLRYEGGREHKGSMLTAQAKEAQSEFDLVQARRNVELSQAGLREILGRSPVADTGDLVVEGKFDALAADRNKPDFVKLAESTPVVKELVQQMNIAKLGVKSAKAEFYPGIYASAGASRSSSEWPPEQDQWSIGLSMSLPLFEGGSRSADLSRARSVVRQTEADEKGGRLSTTSSLLSRWIATQNAIDRVKVSEKFLEASKERARISEVQYSSGLLGFDSWIIIEDDFVLSEGALLDAQAGAMTAEAEWIYVKGGTLENEAK